MDPPRAALVMRAMRDVWARGAGRRPGGGWHGQLAVGQRRPLAAGLGAAQVQGGRGPLSSGLPRRVPKANLVEGAARDHSTGEARRSPAPRRTSGQAEQPAARASSEGRSAGSETNGQDTRMNIVVLSTYNQER
ncbi:hypothetical protein LV779_36950 [Streptomyces thinghirensis]|nr:hypothetical protein [Streptomyces thinghirensis]